MPQRTQLHPEIAAVLSDLRQRIRRYVLVEGIALLLAAAALLFWLGFGLDWLYFWTRSLELPRWFRIAFDWAAVGALAVGALLWVAIRLWHRLRPKSLALVLERRFPELNDRLVTAVEEADEPVAGRTPLTAAMLDKTIEDASRAVSNLELDSVFDARPRSRAVVAAAVLVCSVAALALTNFESFNRWVRAYVQLEPVYWTRETELIVRVVAEPGDRIRDFDDFHYKHPRGADLNLIVEVPEGKKVPDRVQLGYQLEGNRGRAVAHCTQTQGGSRSFRYSMSGLLDSMHFEVFGGDYRTRRSYFVEVVDPPRIDGIVLDVLYPEHTGLNREDPETGNVVASERAVHGAQVSLPVETRFRLQAQSNKPLVGVRIETDLGPDRLELKIGRPGKGESGSAVLTRKSSEGKQQQSWNLKAPADAYSLEDGGMQFSAPFHLIATVPEEFVPDLEGTDLALPLPADSRIRLYLEDVDGIESPEAIGLAVNGVLDTPPMIDIELKGIGTSITRKALIPVTGTITDDYGLANARFDFRIDGEESWSPRLFETPLESYPKEYHLAQSVDEPFERFEVLPLDLEMGRKLTLTVFAEDGDNLNGPHTSRGERYTFDIVSNEELLSILHAKELNLRRRFEQIISEVKQIDQDLTNQRSPFDEWRQLSRGGANGNAGLQEQLRSVEVLITASAERALHGINKNRGETAAIEESFYDIREEMVNNAVATRQMLERIDDRILAPLRAINDFDFSHVDESLGMLRTTIQQQGDAGLWYEESIVRVRAMVKHMEAVLLEMQKMETFQEALELLKAIIQNQDELNKKTQTERKRRLIESLR